MTDNERFDSCMKQANFFGQRVYNRQGYQWKVTLGLWALIAGVVSFGWNKGIQMPFWLVIAISLGYGFFWLRAVSISNYNDQAAAMHFREEAEKILTHSESQIAPRPLIATRKSWRWWFGFLGNWAHFFEFATTVVLLTTAYLILKGHTGPAPIPHWFHL